MHKEQPSWNNTSAQAPYRNVQSLAANNYSQAKVAVVGYVGDNPWRAIGIAAAIGVSAFLFGQIGQLIELRNFFVKAVTTRPFSFWAACANEQNILRRKGIVAVTTLGTETSVPYAGIRGRMNQPHTDALQHLMVRRNL